MIANAIIIYFKIIPSAFVQGNNFLISFKLEYKFRNFKSIKRHPQISFDYKCIANNYMNSKALIYKYLLFNQLKTNFLNRLIFLTYL
ncbi:hypothetical protein DMB68_11000 [Flavobacterium hydrophilum]|uniref:Uncharacterized protein n=1 Tax=Flavobacterium hydrophilum TaxID=2211445 RepID=A0A2V4CGW4_9FLAO|nr:hypothetical protein DMB68_11000 [Flavobacterium hydrophilum]